MELAGVDKQYKSLLASVIAMDLHASFLRLKTNVIKDDIWSTKTRLSYDLRRCYLKLPRPCFISYQMGEGEAVKIKCFSCGYMMIFHSIHSLQPMSFTEKKYIKHQGPDSI